MKKKLISIIIPAYNEAEGLDELKRRIQNTINNLTKYSFEVIIVENGSFDNSYQKLLEIHKEDNRFKVIQLSRNFKPDGGTSAGLEYANGDAAILMNADLQDPPELIPKFIELWEQGHDIVYGVIKKRLGASLLRKIVSRLFYYTIYYLTEGVVQKNVSDFKLLDRKVYEVLNNMPEHNRFTRGMISWSGFKSIGVPFIRQPRYKDGGTIKVLNPIQHAKANLGFIMNAIFTFSDFPLKLIMRVGVLTSLLSFFLGIYFLGGYLIYGMAGKGYVPGQTSLMLVILFLFGMLFIFLGVIGEYIAKIYEEVKQRPNYIIKNKIGLK